MSEALTFLVVAVAAITVDGDHGTAGRAAAVCPRELRVAISVQRQVPHQACRGTMLDRTHKAFQIKRQCQVRCCGELKSGRMEPYYSHVVNVPLHVQEKKGISNTEKGEIGNTRVRMRRDHEP